ncbi:MAG: hypothetical protein ACFFBD_19475, partial [Candidatus Hodarchaeota archaeon]
MKFTKSGKINPNVTTEIKPLELVDKAVFKRLDYLLEYLLKENSNIHHQFIEKLIQKLSTLVKTEDSNESVDIIAAAEKYPHLRNKPELVKLHLNAFLQLLHISHEDLKEGTTIKIPDRNYWRHFVLRYYQALVLSEIMGKKKAINLLKEFIDQYTISVGSLIEKYDTLETMRSDHINELQENPEVGWVSVFSDVEDGKY